jgi:hypothetical protein
MNPEETRFGSFSGTCASEYLYKQAYKYSLAYAQMRML